MPTLTERQQIPRPQAPHRVGGTLSRGAVALCTKALRQTLRRRQQPSLREPSIWPPPSDRMTVPPAGLVVRTVGFEREDDARVIDGTYADELGFIADATGAEILAWLATPRSLWKQRCSTGRPLPIGEPQKSLLRPVSWLGNWQFACLVNSCGEREVGGKAIDVARVGERARARGRRWPD
ncbi:MAG: hypothetical protein JNM84_10215 [Planctomycetes bacterium]|nr:hypothetical protein [Planctomycetota bacterium]